MLENRPSIQDWQIRQAGNAVSLFLQFIGKPAKSDDRPPAEIQSGKQEPPTWEKAIDDMHRAMRVKHYSVRTE